MNALTESQTPLVALVEPVIIAQFVSQARTHSAEAVKTHLVKISSNLAGIKRPSESYTAVSEPCFERCPFLIKTRKNGSGRTPGAVNHEKKK